MRNLSSEAMAQSVLGAIRLEVKGTGAVRPVTRKGSVRALDLIEQRADPGTIVDIVGGQLRCHDLSGTSIHADVKLSPRPARPGAVLLDQPLARAAQFQASAIHQQM